MSDSLDAIGLRQGTDKSSAYHGYLSRLEPYFKLQPRPLRLLEIGVLHGRSIRMWLEYFPDSMIFGVDTVVAHDVADPRFVFYHADAADLSWWDTLGTFRVIIDDGNHNLFQVKSAYDFGFNHLEPGGLWIIEDTCRMDYHPADLMRPSLDELQGHNRDYCGHPARDCGRMAFIHFYKGLIVIGRK